MGFLYALLLMCSWMIYGGAHFYVNVCNITMEEGNLSTHSHFEAKISKSHYVSRSHPFDSCNWFVQSLDRMGDLQCIAAHRLGGIADNLSNISNCLVRYDNK